MNLTSLFFLVQTNLSLVATYLVAVNYLCRKVRGSAPITHILRHLKNLFLDKLITLKLSNAFNQGLVQLIF